MLNSKTDRFYYNQPEPKFIEDLKMELHSVKPSWFGKGKISFGMVDAKGAFLKINFEDSDNLLETSCRDFNRFLDIYEISGDNYPINIEFGETENFEAYQIVVTPSSCTVCASDTEGIRRALVFIEDEMMKNEGPFLTLGEINRKPSVRTRITRGSFSPTNRPPKNIDELENDVDYYPDEYLNRLAHDGANGIWIYTYFRKLLTFDEFPEYGKDREKRILKLKKIIDKCKRYGIKVYVFAIEPEFLNAEMTKKYPDAVGYTRSDGISSFCSYTSIGEKYCREMIGKLFSELHDLGGFINITDGERMTVCSNFQVNNCPHCSHISRGEILAHTLELFSEGKRESETDGEYISWTYGHRYWKYDDIEEYVKKAPSDVMLMQNFEDAGFEEQLGKTRCAYDYWLSYAGPSQMFTHTANCAKKYGKTMFAKLQVCTSHEIGSVPYIPVPGILFEKYKKCYEFDVKGVMQCWYSGNYSCLMSKMAGDLSFCDDFSNKHDALFELASKYYGKSNAQSVVKAWELFEKAYKNYPINILFSYYGPMHDSVVWNLSLEPRDKELPRSWLVVDASDGDRISDCLGYGHTLDEVLELTNRMKTLWHEGLSYLESFDDELFSVSKAIGILFESGHNILKFYALREELAHGEIEKLTVLNEMEEVVDKEIQNSKSMIELCKKDNRLGYHGEAEGFKFFTEKLESRISQLQTLKKTEFIQVRERIIKKEIPLSFFLGDSENGIKLICGDVSKAGYIPHPSLDASFRMSYDDEYIYVELKGEKINRFSLCFEFVPLWPSPSVEISEGKIRLSDFVWTHQSVFGDRIDAELSKYDISGNVIRVSREKFEISKLRPMRVRIAADDIPWITKPDAAHTLGKETITPEEFMWLMP